jgi:hypothetical protein
VRSQRYFHPFSKPFSPLKTSNAAFLALHAKIRQKWEKFVFSLSYYQIFTCYRPEFFLPFGFPQSHPCRRVFEKENVKSASAQQASAR